MSRGLEVVRLVVGRFLCKRDSDNTWVVSPKAAPWLVRGGVSLSRSLKFAPDDEWKSYKSLSSHRQLIHFERDTFSDAMTRMVRELPGEIDRFTYSLTPDEFRILLVYAGSEVYEFFARGHRFGAPPRRSE